MSARTAPSVKGEEAASSTIGLEQAGGVHGPPAPFRRTIRTVDREVEIPDAEEDDGSLASALPASGIAPPDSRESIRMQAQVALPEPLRRALVTFGPDRECPRESLAGIDEVQLHPMGVSPSGNPDRVAKKLVTLWLDRVTNRMGSASGSHGRGAVPRSSLHSAQRRSGFDPRRHCQSHQGRRRLEGEPAYCLRRRHEQGAPTMLDVGSVIPHKETWYSRTKVRARPA